MDTSEIKTFKFFHTQWCWGLYALLGCVLRAGARPEGETDGDLFISYSPSAGVIPDEDKAWLSRGLEAIRVPVLEAWKGDLPLTIEVARLDVIVCDHQEEVLYCALLGWAAEHLGIEPPPYRLVFHEEENRYELIEGQS